MGSAKITSKSKAVAILRELYNRNIKIGKTCKVVEFPIKEVTFDKKQSL